MRRHRRPWKRLMRAAGVAGGLVGSLALMSVLSIPSCMTTDQRTRIVLAPRATGDAIVVTDHPLASEVGARVLEAGGNAVDAVIATALALAVVRPDAANLGGGGFMLVHMRGTDGAAAETVVIDSRETAPAAATHDMFLDENGDFDSDLALWSGLASGVPGSVAGLEHAHRRFGTMPWPDLVQPAVDLAAQGFVIDARFDSLIAEHEERLSRSPLTAQLFLEDARRSFRTQTPWIQDDLAQTLRALQAGGDEAFYGGKTARLIVDELAKWDGVMTLEDLASYRVIERQPLRGGFRGYELASVPPPSSGGPVLLLLLHMAEALDLRSRGLDDIGTKHLLIEAMRRAYAVRSSAFGDPAFVDMDVDRIVSTEFAETLARSIGPRASASDTLHIPGIELERATTGREGENTTHLVVVDGEGNAVSFTTTLNATFGNGLVIEGGGFLMNNEMDDFTGKPGAPNLYGLIQGEKNTIAPGKRPLSSMAPTLVFENGAPIMALGSPGGSRIITAVFQVALNHLELGLEPAESVRRARVHHQYLPDRVYLERDGLAAATQAALAEIGHRLDGERPSIGHVHAAMRTGDGWVGVADHRRGGAAAGLRR